MVRGYRTAGTGLWGIITSGGRPAARLVPFRRDQFRELGFDAGRITIPEDFDDPMPLEMVEDFER
jgi:antitoxin (DNA-binding transcriptional repressor) of toxin-antitoxin stability system